MPRMQRALLAVVLLVATSLATGLTLAAPAAATFSGADGRLVFVRANQISTIAASGGPVTKLTSSGKNYRPEWSPDGRRIAYVNETSAGRRDVWLMNADGSGKTRVSSVGDVVEGVAWSPNGSRLAFIGSGSRLMWIRATSPFGSPHPFLGYRTNDSEASDENPSVRHALTATRTGFNGEVVFNGTLGWSSDNRISYVGPDAYFDYSLQVYSVATGESRALTWSGADCCGYDRWTEFFWGPQSQMGYSLAQEQEGPGSDYNPTAIIYPGVPSVESGDTGGAPSPSGTRIAVTNATSGTTQVYVQNLDGTGRRLLTQGYQADWQRR
jgi:Tol biopolymer transport system component